MLRQIAQRLRDISEEIDQQQSRKFFINRGFDIIYSFMPCYNFFAFLYEKF